MMQQLSTNYAHGPQPTFPDVASALAERLMMPRVFTPGDIRLTMTATTGLIYGGVMPVAAPLEIQLDRAIAADYFLQQRALAVINIGGTGWLTVDGTTTPLGQNDGFYVGRGVRHVRFASLAPDRPAKFYVVSHPTAASFPPHYLPFDGMLSTPLGDAAHCNRRRVYSYLATRDSSGHQFQLGLTVMAPGSVWDTVAAPGFAPGVAVDLYLGMPADATVLHMLGDPGTGRPLAMTNETAVLNPSGARHSAVGTAGYAVIWAVVGQDKED